MYVVTADQIDSRRTGDEVPQAITLLAGVRPGAERAFERTAGDEIQGVTDDPADVVAVVESLVREDRWRIGIGVGSVEWPLPDSPRAGRGPAFHAARDAVTAAHSSTGQLAVRLGGGVRRTAAVGETDEVRARHTRYAESALALLARLLRARTAEGWEVVDLLAAGLTQRAAAERLGVSASAVSQRARRAGWVEQGRAVELAVHHLSLADDRTEP